VFSFTQFPSSLDIYSTGLCWVCRPVEADFWRCICRKKWWESIRICCSCSGSPYLVRLIASIGQINKCPNGWPLTKCRNTKQEAKLSPGRIVCSLQYRLHEVLSVSPIWFVGMLHGSVWFCDIELTLCAYCCHMGTYTNKASCARPG